MSQMRIEHTPTQGDGFYFIGEYHAAACVPADDLSWKRRADLCRKLNRRPRDGYRRWLPTDEDTPCNHYATPHVHVRFARRRLEALG